MVKVTNIKLVNRVLYMSSDTTKQSDIEKALDSVPPEERSWWEGMIRLSEASEEETRVMTDAEVFNAAVDVVANKLHSDGNEILQVSTILGSEPSIWFKVGDQLKYIVVTFARYPKKAIPPENSEEIIKQLKEQNADGYWIGVNFAHELEPFDPEWDGGMELMIGFKLLPFVYEPIPLESL